MLTKGLLYFNFHILCTISYRVSGGEMFSMVKDPCFTILVSHMKECGLMADLKVKILKSC